MNVRLVHSVGSKHSVGAKHGAEAEQTAEALPGSDKERLIETLRVMLQDSFRLRNEGSAYAKLTHAQGCVDGYMRALTLSGVVNDRELLQIIAEERRGAHGPSTRRVELEVIGAEASA